MSIGSALTIALPHSPRSRSRRRSCPRRRGRARRRDRTAARSQPRRRSRRGSRSCKGSSGWPQASALSPALQLATSRRLLSGSGNLTGPLPPCCALPRKRALALAGTRRAARAGTDSSLRCAQRLLLGGELTLSEGRSTPCSRDTAGIPRQRGTRPDVDRRPGSGDRFASLRRLSPSPSSPSLARLELRLDRAGGVGERMLVNLRRLVAADRDHDLLVGQSVVGDDTQRLVAPVPDERNRDRAALTRRQIDHLFHEPSIVLAEAERRYPKGARHLDPRLGRPG